ncbi:MAG: hypothetical protein J0H98_08585 [Solirubrobacterales bacterium]|nr:hypothetical protein [Solirubrobacterales bacterium]
MIQVEGQSNESIVLDGEWFEKLRGGQSKSRIPASSFVGVELTEIERRKKLFGGEKETLVQATFQFDGGPFVGFITGAEHREKVEQIVAGLEAARDS